MNTVRAELIKLGSTLTTWFSWVAIASIGIFSSLLFAYFFGRQRFDNGESILNTHDTVIGMHFTWPIMLVWAGLAITTEYRFNTIKTSLLIQPQRGRYLWKKATVVGLFAGILGLMVVCIAYGAAKVTTPNSPMVSLSDSADARSVLGFGAIYALSGFLAVGIGTLVRHSAGTITLLLLLYTGLFDTIIRAFPIGETIYQWLPFPNAKNFLAASDNDSALPDPWMSLAMYGGWALAIMLLAQWVFSRRDA